MKRQKFTQGSLLESSKKALRRSVAFAAAFFIAGTSYAQIAMQSGSYVGNGAYNRTIGGAGFTPDVVMVKAANSHESQIKTSTMGPDSSKQMQNAAGIYVNRILSLESDGFAIGTDKDVNESGVTYYWTAFKAGADLKVGSYMGNDLDNRNITGVGITPDMVFVLPESGNRASFKTSAMPGEDCYHFGSAELPNTIQALITDGFQVGNDSRANNKNDKYHYVAFKSSATSLQIGTYAGNDVDDRTITGIAFQPEYMFVKKKDNTYAVQRSKDMPANSSVEFAGSGIDVNRLKAFTSNGFTIGTHAQVNDNNKTYYYVCFRNSCIAPSAATASNNGPICSGSALNLKSSVSGFPIPTASWAGAGTFSSKAIANPVVTGATTGNYVVTYTNACGTATATTSVVVNQAPSPVVVDNAITICEGQTLNLTAVSTGKPAPTFSWTGPNSFSSTEQSPNISAAGTNAEGTYFVTAMNSCGEEHANVVVTVNHAPSPVVVGNAITICEGQTLNLTAASTGKPAPTYSWTGPNSFESNNQNPSISEASTLAAGTYEVTAYNSCGEENASVVVTVNQAPSSVTAFSNGPICEGTTLNLTSSANAVPAPQFSWTGPGSFTSAVQNPTITEASAANYSGSYVVTAKNSCGEQTATVAVTVIPTPTVGFAPTTISGGNATLHFSGTPNVRVTYNINGGAEQTIDLNASGLADLGPIAITAMPKKYNLVSAEYKSGLGCRHTPSGSVTLVNTIVTQYSNKDAYMRDGSDNTNEGANPLLRISNSGNNRTIVGFNMSEISTVNLVSAQLVMNIADNSDNWGSGAPGTRYVDAHRVLTDWTEGNGWNENGKDRGTGVGVTWMCPKDGNIANTSNTGDTKWNGNSNASNGGTFADATAPGVLFYNGLTGDISWDVTADVLTGASNGWIIKKRNEGQNGRVYFQSRENTNKPKLVLTYATASAARLIKNATKVTDILKVYPNPASSMIHVEIPQSSNESKLSVCDITGREVASKTIAANTTAPVAIEIANVSAGVYMVKVIIDGTAQVAKFIKK